MEERHPHQSERAVAIRERLIAVAEEYIGNGHGDANAEQRLCSPDDNIYWQQLSEVLLGHQLAIAGVPFVHQAVGPDFRIEVDGRRIWVEVITPTPANVPAAWRAPASNGVRDFPHEEILLRWTAAIKQKAEVLLGNPRGANGYLAGGIVGPDDCYVIAVNGRLLRGFDGGLAELNGVSQFPFAVEATFSVGPLQIRIDRNTLRSSAPRHQQRYLIHKPKGAPVPTDTFIDPQFAPISAIWATDIDELSLLDRTPQMVTVHNPLASNPLPSELLPAHDEYVARLIDADTYQLDRVGGQLAPPEGDCDQG
jgi:type I restriction enzyme S subunit